MNAFAHPSGRLPGDTNDDIFLVNTDGTGLVRLTTDPGNDLFPAWSPEGSKLVFLSTRTGVSQVWVMDADGGNPQQLTTDPAPKDQVPDWSPDGTRIAYQSFGTGGGDIYVMNGRWHRPDPPHHRPGPRPRSGVVAGRDQDRVPERTGPSDRPQRLHHERRRERPAPGASGRRPVRARMAATSGRGVRLNATKGLLGGNLRLSAREAIVWQASQGACYGQRAERLLKRQ
jgi:dipeptidyl aminopeptidase/acylaminoacyl peptidase